MRECVCVCVHVCMCGSQTSKIHFKGSLQKGAQATRILPSEQGACRLLSEQLTETVVGSPGPSLCSGGWRKHLLGVWASLEDPAFQELRDSLLGNLLVFH